MPSCGLGPCFDSTCVRQQRAETTRHAARRGLKKKKKSRVPRAKPDFGQRHDSERNGRVAGCFCVFAFRARSPRSASAGPYFTPALNANRSSSLWGACFNPGQNQAEYACLTRMAPGLQSVRHQACARRFVDFSRARISICPIFQ